MKIEQKKITDFATPYRMDGGTKIRLKHFDPADNGNLQSEEEAEELLKQGVKLIRNLEERLYAQQTWSLLLIFQGIDASGKDGTIEHVMSGVNPEGCQITSFKEPSSVELKHDFLWRCTAALPERGKIGIFNRSYYEEVLVTRVHKDLLGAEKIPPELVTKNIWDERFEDIRAYERHLARNGFVVRKFFFHVSKAEQKKRFLARLDEPAKNWKFSLSDLKERVYWNEYMEAYEKAIRHTALPHAPWYIVPADHKWFAHLVVAGAIIETLDSLGLAFPEVTSAQRKMLQKARKILGKK
jgi:PPK2 family polyphosphate:nucleotide phosphotransferase